MFIILNKSISLGACSCYRDKSQLISFFSVTNAQARRDFIRYFIVQTTEVIMTCTKLAVNTLESHVNVYLTQASL